MKQIRQILVAIDSSAMAEEALIRAISVAKATDAQLMVLHVIEPLFFESPFFDPVNEDKIKAKIADQMERLNSKNSVKYLLFVESGKVADAITLKAQKIQADLLVVGSHSKEDISSKHFGSTTLKVIQNTHIPVLIVKNKVHGIYQKMIAPTNLSAYSKESIRFANALFAEASKKYLYAHETVSELQAVTYSISDEQRETMRKTLAEKARDALQQFADETGGAETELIDYTASINEDLLAFIEADTADLLVLGSKGVDNLNSFIFGSTASYMLQRSPLDVLVHVPS